jgi:hypothetical protein
VLVHLIVVPGHRPIGSWDGRHGGRWPLCFILVLFTPFVEVKFK